MKVTVKLLARLPGSCEGGKSKESDARLWLVTVGERVVQVTTLISQEPQWVSADVVTSHLWLGLDGFGPGKDGWSDDDDDSSAGESDVLCAAEDAARAEHVTSRRFLFAGH